MNCRRVYGRVGQLLLIALLLCSCGAESNVSTEQLCEQGVSLTLANHRKESIKNLQYDLSFALPSEKELPVEATIEIRFELDKREEVVLDFREQQEKIHSLRVNGSESDYQFVNQHIVVPVKHLKTRGENLISICFTAGDQSLNRNDDYLYTLLVPDRARTLFPCFEQPNLKALFRLKLEVPAGWCAISNTVVTQEEQLMADRKQIVFGQTEPLSTYLFSFVAGRFEKQTFRAAERTFAVYYRETDPKKLSQLPIIFNQVASSLDWLERYTEIKYPFAKYDFIILPGFQYGGMEHTGATLYNDTQLFLGECPTPDEELRRASLIAHETAHMWFGDLVTMDWFNDVWTKEVFANYFAARMVEPLFPSINHKLNGLKTYTASALSEDRTQGTTAIRQPLDNLSSAGLIYGNIIYNKAPIMMNKLVELMGEEAFRRSIGSYLRKYAYGNATWENLVDIFAANSDADVRGFSRVWVNEKGMPTIEVAIEGDSLLISQTDRYNRGLCWPQTVGVALYGEGVDTCLQIALSRPRHSVALPFKVERVIPNCDGQGYGLFLTDSIQRNAMLNAAATLADPLMRQAVVMQLYENYLAGNIAHDRWAAALLDGLKSESNPLIASTLVGYVGTVMPYLSAAQLSELENRLFEIISQHPLTSCRLQTLRLLIGNGVCPRTVKRLYSIWSQQSGRQLNENDYTKMAYELAVRRPSEAATILQRQRARITNPDRLRQFDYISRATVADTTRLDALFEELLQPENRRIEPWASSALYYLNHPLRAQRAVKYIRPGLEVLQEVQLTGDIFFPRDWVGSLLAGHYSREAYHQIELFFDDHRDYPILLKNKINQAAFHICNRLTLTTE
ncbi:MAG: M1 family aminopeptidase [Tidjanibacter sp.]|nr:M1 family aminopeptidase [Tidjanibacter sp.]